MVVCRNSLLSEGKRETQVEVPGEWSPCEVPNRKDEVESKSQISSRVTEMCLRISGLGLFKLGLRVQSSPTGTLRIN